MERESNQMQTLCRSGCGFYGSPATDGLCSLCYKEALKKKQQLPNTPSSHCNALSMASAATPTNHINPINPLMSHADFNHDDSMSQSHLPSKKSSSQELPSRPSSTLVPGAAVQDRPGGQQGSAHDVASISSLSPVTEGRVSNHTGFVLESAVDQSQAAAISTPESLNVPAEASPSAVPGVSTDSTEEDKDGDKDKKKKNRCRVCRKKVGLTGFECRCGGLFCGIHRYSDKHDCDFDYRELGAKEIRRNNPVVVGEKIQKI